MNEQANTIQAVINTLQSLNLPATVDNMSKLLGCVQVLTEVMNALNVQATEVKLDENDHAE